MKMTTLAENQKKNTFLRWETTLESMQKYVIWNNNPEEENICFSKIFLKFEKPRWQIRAIVVSDKNLVQKRYIKVTILWKLKEFQKSRHH